MSNSSHNVNFNKKAQDDIQEITEYVMDHAGPDATLKTIRLINSTIAYLADNPWLGGPAEGFNEKVRMWLTKNKKYKIYFRRTKQNSIRILRVYGSNRRPLTPKDLY